VRGRYAILKFNKRAGKPGRRFRSCLLALTLLVAGCDIGSRVDTTREESQSPSAAELFDSGALRAIAYGGYRSATRAEVPSVDDIKEDLKILSGLGFKMIRTYNTQQYDETRRIFLAIEALQAEDPSFEMYVMLGVWIDCAGAGTDAPDHEGEDHEANQREVDAAIRFAKAYSDIVKVIAVGNEAMVRWAATYYVQPKVVLKWVRHFQTLKQAGEIESGVWVTSSDNFASWGGGEASYQTPTLNALILAVDFVSMHTYPFHDTHYNPAFWTDTSDEVRAKDPQAAVSAAMERAAVYAQNQYVSTKRYVSSVDPGKAIHIGETGWASLDNGFYGPDGSNAAGERQQQLYFELMIAWARAAGVVLVLFEAFDEPWKDAKNPAGSENHFGLIDGQNRAKRVLWAELDAGALHGLTRGGRPIVRSPAP
jgi:exo-beta-1,3-glucanase (GH17 family)